MTTNNKVRTEIQIIAPIYNTKSRAPRKYKSKTQVCDGHNIAFYSGSHFLPFVRLNPIQTKADQKDSVVYEVYNDGSRRKLNTRDFFSKLVPEEWIQINCDLQEDDLDDLWSEDLEDRPNTLIFHIDCSSLQAFNECLTLGYSKENKSGRFVRYMDFKGKVSFESDSTNHTPLKLREIPSFLSDDEVPVNTTVAAKAAASITPDVEHIVVDNENPTRDELEDQLFATSHAKPPAPVGDFSNEDLAEPMVKTKTATKFW